MNSTASFEVEIDRLPHADIQLGNICSEFDAILNRFSKQPTQHLEIGNSVRTAALELWQQAILNVQESQFDDRPLYWARHKLHQTLAINGISTYSPIVESTSRGLNSIANDNDRLVVLTGFDPFNLDTHIDQSNPAGLIALSLHGRMIEGHRIVTSIFPVRYSDFDKWIVEKFLRNHLTDDKVSLVVTVSMGRDQFDLERFVGKRRSLNKRDNAGVVAATNSPNVPPFLYGPEFLEFSLPIDGLATDSNSDGWHVRDNRGVTTLESGEMFPEDIQQLDGMTAVNGSGGGFLSNEIAYRSQLLKKYLRSPTPVGHIHVPKISGYEAEVEKKIVSQFEALLASLIGNLKAIY